MSLTAAALAAGDDECTRLVLARVGQASAKFRQVAQREGDQIVRRDAEDAEQLARGVRAAQAAGVLPELQAPCQYVPVSVDGLPANAVADKILAAMTEAQRRASVVVLTGLSGTGKGTTVKKLTAALPNGARLWSNGNLFRALTLLAVGAAEAAAGADGADEGFAATHLAAHLTPAAIDGFVAQLKFAKFAGQWDVQIRGVDAAGRPSADADSVLVSQVATTLLQAPRVARNVPTVAGTTQGQVVLFASEAVALMGQDDVVLVEGRAQTLDHMAVHLRFELVVGDNSVLGERRAAQRLAGAAVASGKLSESDEASNAKLLEELLETL